MKQLGDLQNFNLGMGLIVKPGETLTTRKSFFEGLGQATESNNKYLLIGLAILILLIFAK